jgi:hypothetical protein
MIDYLLILVLASGVVLGACYIRSELSDACKL